MNAAGRLFRPRVACPIILREITKLSFSQEAIVE